MPTTAVLLNDTSRINHHGCKTVVTQIKQNCAKVGISIGHCVPLQDDWKEERHLSKILRSDAVIVNGEGTMHSTKPRCLNLASSASFCRERGIKSFLINSVYQRNDESVAARVKLFDLVFVRESASKRELAAQGIEARVVPDMVFTHELPKDLQDLPRSGLLFSDSMDDGITLDLYEAASAIPNATFLSVRANVSDKTLVGRIASLLKRSWAAALPERTPRSWRKEAKQAAKQRRLRRTLSLYSPHLNDLLRALARSELVVTGRFHMVCFALLTGTPLIGVSSNTQKIEGMLGDVGLEGRLVANTAQLGDIRGTHSLWRDDEVQRVERYVRHAKKEIAQMFADIRSVVDTT